MRRRGLLKPVTDAEVRRFAATVSGHAVHNVRAWASNARLVINSAAGLSPVDIQNRLRRECEHWSWKSES